MPLCRFVRPLCPRGQLPSVRFAGSERDPLGSLVFSPPTVPGDGGHMQDSSTFQQGGS